MSTGFAGLKSKWESKARTDSKSSSSTTSTSNMKIIEESGSDSSSGSISNIADQVSQSRKSSMPDNQGKEANDHSSSSLAQEESVPPVTSTIAMIIVDVQTGLITDINTVARNLFDSGNQKSLIIGTSLSSLFENGKCMRRSGSSSSSYTIDSKMPKASSLSRLSDSNETISNLALVAESCPNSSLRFLTECRTTESHTDSSSSIINVKSMLSWPWTKVLNITSQISKERISLFYHENPNVVVVHRPCDGKPLYLSHWLMKERNSDQAICLFQEVNPVPNLAACLSDELYSKINDSIFDSTTELPYLIRKCNGTSLIRMSRYGLINYVSTSTLLGHDITDVLDKPFMRFVHSDDVTLFCQNMSMLKKCLFSFINIRWMLPDNDDDQIRCSESDFKSPFIWVKVFLIKISEIPYAVIEQITDLSVLTDLFSKFKVMETIQEECEEDDLEHKEKVESNEFDQEETVEESKARKVKERQQRQYIRDQMNWINCVSQRLVCHSSSLLGAWNEAQLVLWNSPVVGLWKDALFDVVQKMIFTGILERTEQSQIFDYQQKNFLTESMLLLCGLDGLQQDLLLDSLGIKANLKNDTQNLENEEATEREKFNIDPIVPLEQIWYKLLFQVRTIVLKEPVDFVSQTLLPLSEI